MDWTTKDEQRIKALRETKQRTDDEQRELSALRRREIAEAHRRRVVFFRGRAT